MSAAEWIAKERDEFACELSQADGRTIKVELWTYVETDNFVEAERVADGRLRALDALETVLALHSQHNSYLHYCRADGEKYPCPTVTAVEAALRGES